MNKGAPPSSSEEKTSSSRVDGIVTAMSQPARSEVVHDKADDGIHVENNDLRVIDSVSPAAISSCKKPGHESNSEGVQGMGYFQKAHPKPQTPKP